METDEQRRILVGLGHLFHDDPLHASASLEEILEWMARHGSSVDLNWGEDTSCWEVAWISSGDRFLAALSDARAACWAAIGKAAEKRAPS